MFFSEGFLGHRTFEFSLDKSFGWVFYDNDHHLCANTVILAAQFETLSEVARGLLKSNIRPYCVKDSEALRNNSRAVIWVKDVLQVLRDHHDNFGVCRHTVGRVATEEHGEVRNSSRRVSIRVLISTTQCIFGLFLFLADIAFSAAGEDQ